MEHAHTCTYISPHIHTPHTYCTCTSSPHPHTYTLPTHTYMYLQGVPSSLDVGVVHQEGRGEDGGEEEEADPREAFQDGSSKGGDGDQGLGA